LAVGNSYVYVDRATYDSAVILYNRYAKIKDPEEYNGINPILALGKYFKQKLNQESAKIFFEALPRPINILGVYLNLIKNEIVDNSLSNLCGILSIITDSITAEDYLTIPEEVRKNVLWSLSIEEEYQTVWEKFFSLATVYGESVPAPWATKAISPEKEKVVETYNAEIDTDGFLVLDDSFFDENEEDELQSIKQTTEVSKPAPTVSTDATKPKDLMSFIRSKKE
jgi:hypothetical protein